MYIAILYISKNNRDVANYAKRVEPLRHSCLQVVTCISVLMAAACILSNNSWNYNNKITADFQRKMRSQCKHRLIFILM